MTAYSVIVHERAMQDIERNAAWWAKHHSAAQAIMWYETILHSIKGLTTLPESHPLADENQSFKIGLRQMLCGLGSKPSYRAIFTIEENCVHVLTVRRSTQDVLRPNDLGD